MVRIEWCVLNDVAPVSQADEWKKKHEELQETVRYAYASPSDPRVTLFILRTGMCLSPGLGVYFCRIVDN